MVLKADVASLEIFQILEVTGSITKGTLAEAELEAQQ